MFLKKHYYTIEDPASLNQKKMREKVFSYYLGEILANGKRGSMFCTKGHYLPLNICIYFFDLTFINKDIKCYLWKLSVLDLKGIFQYVRMTLILRSILLLHNRKNRVLHTFTYKQY